MSVRSRAIKNNYETNIDDSLNCHQMPYMQMFNPFQRSASQRSISLMSQIMMKQQLTATDVIEAEQMDVKIKKQVSETCHNPR